MTLEVEFPGLGSDNHHSPPAAGHRHGKALSCLFTTMGLVPTRSLRVKLDLKWVLKAFESLVEGGPSNLSRGGCDKNGCLAHVTCNDSPRGLYGACKALDYDR